MALDSIDYQQIKMALKDCLREEGITDETFLAPRWSGGKVLIQPGDSERFEAACDPARAGAEPLAPGRYQVVGIIPAIDSELRSDPVDFVVDP